MRSMLLPQEIVRLKREGGTLRTEDIAAFIEGVTSGRISDGPVAAFCMAVLWRGLNVDERTALTLAMARSGTVLQWDVPGPVVDKHSTGGVGDKTSLVIAPLVAACGGFVPMICGRGLGHTGGTWDKFDSIPGYQTQPDIALFQQVVRTVGCAITGQTATLAPADRRIYAIRDTSATVESLDLITASILSKKIAAGLDALVMDVKTGSGAFMKERTAAEALAASLREVASRAGLRFSAHLTDMDQVLGRTAGNALEMQECVAWLRTGQVEPRLKEVTLLLAADMLVQGGLVPDVVAARQACETALASGAAAERFSRMVAALGGPSDFLEQAEHYLPCAPVVRPVWAEDRSAQVVRIDVYAVGMAIVALGGGRINPTDTIDPAVGLTDIIGLGELADRPLALIHAPTEAEADEAEARLRKAIILGRMSGV